VSAGDRAIQLGGGEALEGYRPQPDPASNENFEGKDLRAIANLIEGSQAPFALVGCVQCTIANNTVVDPKLKGGLSWILRILAEPPDGLEAQFLPPIRANIVNNVFYFNASQLYATLNIASDVMGVEAEFTISNNLWFAHDDPTQSAPDLATGSETAGIVGEDPAFTVGFAIDGSSPAAGAGTPRSELHGDQDGRCYLDPPSVGAYEVP
jgi:hypothetical protein